MILLIDNYDSFSYNLYQLIGTFRTDIKVIRNDEMRVSEIERLAPEYIILSPGPGTPGNAGICEEVVKQLSSKSKILGVCLGHQAICETFGAEIGYAKQLMHGRQSECAVDTQSVLFRGLPQRIKAARYHSLAAKKESLPDVLKITAQTDDGEIMAVEHRYLPVYGVQFHPESVLTEQGGRIIQNFLGGNDHD